MSLTRSEIVIVILILSIVLTIGIYNYMYQDHDKVADLELSYSGDSETLLDSLNQGNNSILWINKAVKLTDKITAIDSSTIQLNNNTFCQLSELPNGYHLMIKYLL